MHDYLEYFPHSCVVNRSRILFGYSLEDLLLALGIVKRYPRFPFECSELLDQARPLVQRSHDFPVHFIQLVPKPLDVDI